MGRHLGSEWLPRPLFKQDHKPGWEEPEIERKQSLTPYELYVQGCIKWAHVSLPEHPATEQVKLD